MRSRTSHDVIHRPFYRSIFPAVLTVIILIMAVIGWEEESVQKNEQKDTKEETRTTDCPSQSQIKIERMIRVLIMDNGFSSRTQSKVCFQAESDLIMTAGEEKKTIPQGEELCLTAESPCFEQVDRVHVEAAVSGTAIKVISLSRGCGQPQYEGSFDVYWSDEGLVLINEVSLEAYLYGVVPSEMPASYGMEALKAQAVCARSYACRRMQTPAYPEYDADVDDSVQFQVYNNYEVTRQVREAVDATAGEVAISDNQIIDAYFFSTSCGSTTNWQVWGEDEQRPYLQAVVLNEKERGKNLSDESSFVNFLNDTQTPNYDADGAWYRWEAVLDFDLLPGRLSEQIGKLTAIEILRRGEGGVVTQLQLKGTKGEQTLNSEYDIRTFCAAILERLSNQEKNVTSLPSLLPSAYFYVANCEGRIITIRGGGYGHGVGMSQHAAKNMAAAGMDYRAILHFFYQNISIDHAVVH